MTRGIAIIAAGSAALAICLLLLAVGYIRQLHRHRGERASTIDNFFVHQRGVVQVTGSVNVHGDLGGPSNKDEIEMQQPSNEQGGTS